ncbi:16048_t:CDS:2, partial [Racocetra fulgida]
MTSLKDISHNIISTINSSSADVQPTIDLIDNFITTQEFHTDRERLDKINKFSSELLSIYNSIQDYPQKFHIFLKCLRALLPILGPDVVISDWCDRILLPVLKSSLQPKDIVEEVKAIIREVLVCETDRVMIFRKEILELYLNESSMIGKAAGEGHGVVGEQVHAFWILCWDKHDSRCTNFDGELIGNDLNITEGCDVQKTDAESDWERCGKFLVVPLLRRHTLHPNLILSDAQKELSDTSRWIKLEPADVVAECIGYDMENASTKHQISELEDFTKKALEGVDSTNAETKTRRPSQAISIQEIMDVHQALKSGVEIVVGDDPWDSKIISSNSISSTSPSDQNLPVTQSFIPSSNVQASVAFLQREIMLLRNELNFELYLKQQHLQHIGRLHRDHVLDISAEAERQNLYNACKNLKLQLEKTQSAFNRQRDENASIKKKHVQWEDELNAKLKKYREEKKEWKTELDKVEEQLREAKADTRKFQEQKRHMEILVAQWNKMEMMLETKEKEINQLKTT